MALVDQPTVQETTDPSRRAQHTAQRVAQPAQGNQDTAPATRSGALGIAPSRILSWWREHRRHAERVAATPERVRAPRGVLPPVAYTPQDVLKIAIARMDAAVDQANQSGQRSDALAAKRQGDRLRQRLADLAG